VRCLTIRLPSEAATAAVLANLRALLAHHPGDIPVVVRFMTQDGFIPLYPGKYRVSLDDELLRALDWLLGKGAAGIEAYEPA
jgi:hypothetical protein